MESMIDRREAVRRVTALLGGMALVGGSSLVSACEQAQRGAAVARGGAGPFTGRDIAFLDEVAETILPETKTPGRRPRRSGVHGADGHRHVHRQRTSHLPRRDAEVGRGVPGDASHLIPGDDTAAAAGPTRAARPRAEGIHGRAARGRDARSLLPYDEGAGPARLLHLGDRLHQGDALRGNARAFRPVRAVHARRDRLAPHA